MCIQITDDIELYGDKLHEKNTSNYGGNFFDRVNDSVWCK